LSRHWQKSSCRSSRRSNGFGGEGGSGIADALTEGLLDFAEYMAGIFDAAIAQFGEFGATIQTAASVFEFVGNIFLAVSESLRVVFNIFELAGNALLIGLGGVLEGLGSWVSSDLEQAGRDLQASGFAAAKQNAKDVDSAAAGAARAGSAAVFGGSGLPQAADGPAGRAVRGARERFAGRDDPARQAQKEADRAAKQAERERAAAGYAALKAAEDARKAEEKRLKAVKKADQGIAKVEEDRAKRALEIEGERFDALSRQSNQALNVSDVRSGGISEILRIASGREDPAVEEYRKQLGELRKIDAKLGELRADRVEIRWQRREGGLMAVVGWREVSGRSLTHRFGEPPTADRKFIVTLDNTAPSVGEVAGAIGIFHGAPHPEFGFITMT
jgi:hypothetical protein